MFLQIREFRLDDGYKLVFTVRHLEIEGVKSVETAEGVKSTQS